MYWTYIVECRDGTLYTGWTNDLKKRTARHNKGLGAKYTRTRYPVVLKYSEEYLTKSEAMQREYEIKQLSRTEKLELIASYADEKRSFGPILDKNSQVIILGSIPGEESLRQQQYYANPRNHFWTIIYTLFGQEVEVSYDKRIEFLLDKGIALWDVIEKCERKGSLDANIRNEKPNDIKGLLMNNINIKLVAFNGTKAYETYKKKVGYFPTDKIFMRLPSTSPIPGKNIKSFPEKLKEWKVVLEFLVK